MLTVDRTKKAYLGDGVHVVLDRFGTVTLTTSDGTRDTNTIVLEDDTLTSLLEWLEWRTNA